MTCTYCYTIMPQSHARFYIAIRHAWACVPCYIVNIINTHTNHANKTKTETEIETKTKELVLA